MRAPDASRKLLVVEDDLALQRQLRWSVEGCQLFQATNRDDALAALRAQEPAVVLLDLGLPPEPRGVTEGFATLDAILALAPATKVIVLSGQDQHAHAVRSVGHGAHDFCAKPCRPDLLQLLVDRAFRVAELERESQRRRHAPIDGRLPGVVGSSPAIQGIARLVARVAPTDVTVVLTGESGTGKELVARAIHAASARAGAPFAAINCAAIPEGLLEAELFGHERGAFTGAIRQTPGRIEAAAGGTLFLDEIGDLAMALQVKLLRFLQERTIERIGGRREIAVDVRVVAATHQDLATLIANGAFREDLYYRLSELTIALPPLRKRPGDPVELARHLLERYATEFGRSFLGLADDACNALERHRWPGNVRELQNRMKRAVLMAEGKRIRARDLELEHLIGETEPINLRAVRERAERAAVRRAIAQTRGNISKAAKILGISRPTLYDLLRQFDLRA